MKRKLGACIAFLVFLANCSDQQMMWVKPGATPDNFTEDRRSCNIWAHRSDNVGSSTDGSVAYGSVFNHCMKVRGWTLQPVPNG